MPGNAPHARPGVVFMALAQGSGELIFGRTPLPSMAVVFVLVDSGLFCLQFPSFTDRPLHVAHAVKASFRALSG